MTEAFSSRPASLADYLAIVRRHVWIVVIPLVLAPVMAFLISSRQTPQYRASAEILVKRADPAAAVAGVTDPTLQVDPVRFLATQAAVARDPKLAQRVAAAAQVRGMSAGTLLGSLSVTPNPDADLMTFAVTNGNPDLATRLVNAYADEFTKYRTELDTASVNRLLANVTAKIKALRANGVSLDSPAYGTLLENQTKLETSGRLLANNSQVLQPAEGAGKISPNPRQKGILGALLGGVVGLGLAFLAEALDKRVRSDREIGQVLGLPLLARIPKPARRLRRAGELVMLAEPRSVAAEPIRALRTNLDFANLERNARTVMVTSAVQREGKTTTIANTAVAMARTGRRVALVDLDLRRPYLNQFFRLQLAPGISDVLLEAIDPLSAMQAVPVPAPRPTGNGAPPGLRPPSSSSNGHNHIDGLLHVLPAGTNPTDPGEVIGSDALDLVLQSLGEQFDIVLIDTPPLLVVGDALTLSAKVDAMFVVTRLKVVQRRMVQELARVLDSCPADKFGYVVTGAELGDAYGYAYGYGYRSSEAESEREHEPVT
jgi:Mrp family chromosome partitioning ATPase/capsular polysaccharide biosynthesis protein